MTSCPATAVSEAIALRHRRLPRTFIAALPDRAGRDRLADLQSALRACWPERDDGWLDPADFHVTLRFLGDLDPSELESALGCLQLPEDEPVLELTCAGVELWPTVRPRLAVARFAATERLLHWADTLERWAVEQGLPAEARTYAPHVTLLRSPRPLDASVALPRPDFTLRFTAVQAMHRAALPRGPRYEGHAEYALRS